MIASLPNALAATNPLAALEALPGKSENDPGILAAVRDAVDPQESVAARCSALEQLDGLGVTLDSQQLRQLLTDQNATVARYALGLILLSTDRQALIEEASATHHVKEVAFCEDLRLLKQMTEL